MTLVDGHRLSHTGGLNGSDISSIPLGAIERVEILTDGASAVYGSDAIAGVINVILRKSYDGIEGTFNLSEPTRSGGSQQQTYAVVAGTHWQTGNVLVSYNGQNQNSLFSRDRSFSQLATDPTTLSPSSHSNAFTVYVNQDVATDTSIYADLLYNARNANSENTFESSPTNITYYSPVSKRQYTANAGLTSHVRNDWVVGLDFNKTEDKENTRIQSSGVDVSDVDNADRGESVELHASGPLISLSSGNIKTALGAGWRRESLGISHPLFAASNISGSRRDTFAYAEAEVPLIRADASRRGLTSLDLSVSARLDHYSDFGSSTNPKFGIVYGVTNDLRLRGSYGTSFRAPLLSDMLTPAKGYLFTAGDDRFSGGAATALFEYGGNRLLSAEKSKSWTATIDYTPTEVRGLSISATYFSYKFNDKIIAPANGNPFLLPLSDPSIAPFTTFFPSSAFLQATASSLVPPILDFTNGGATLSDVQAILNGRYTNASTWTAKGVDFLGDYRFDTNLGSFDLQLNLSRLTVKEQITSSLGFIGLSNQVFGPPKLRARSGVTWSRGPWNISAFANFVSAERDIYSAPTVQVAAFTTVDAHIDYAFDRAPSSWLSDAKLSLGIVNLFDRNPPTLRPTTTASYPGLGYDSTNASPFGRIITLQVTKAFKRK